MLVRRLCAKAHPSLVSALWSQVTVPARYLHGRPGRSKAAIADASTSARTLEAELLALPHDITVAEDAQKLQQHFKQIIALSTANARAEVELQLASVPVPSRIVQVEGGDMPAQDWDEALFQLLVADRPTVVISPGLPHLASALQLLAIAHQGGVPADGVAALAERQGLSVAQDQQLLQQVGERLRVYNGGGASGLLLRQLFDSTSSTYTYLLADMEQREALLIDPVLEKVERDLQLLDELQLTLKYALNTHVHADHVTGTGKIKTLRPGVRSAIGVHAKAAADVKLAAGQWLPVGRHALKALHTPGHTGGCMCYYTHSLGGAVFTGDTLMVRGCGRTDFQDGDASTLYTSVHSQLFTLPGATSVLPAHDYRGFTRSSIGEERTANPRLSKSRDDFIAIMAGLNLAYPKLMDVAVPANMLCGLQV